MQGGRLARDGVVSLATLTADGARPGAAPGSRGRPWHSRRRGDRAIQDGPDQHAPGPWNLRKLDALRIQPLCALQRPTRCENPWHGISTSINTRSRAPERQHLVSEPPSAVQPAEHIAGIRMPAELWHIVRGDSSVARQCLRSPILPGELSPKLRAGQAVALRAARLPLRGAALGPEGALAARASAGL